MRWLVGLALCLLAASATVAAALSPSGDASVGDPSPVYGVVVPEGYRRWELVAAAQEADPLNELRAVLGNAVAMRAYQEETLPFPDGAVLVKLAWHRVQSGEFAPAFVPGTPTTVQVMVKDSRRYADTGGWGFGRFVGGKPVDEAQHRTCFGCRAGNVRDHDRVFTRYAP